MNAFTNHFSFEFRTGIRDKTLLLTNYLFPIGLYIITVTAVDPVSGAESMVSVPIVIGRQLR